MTTDHCVAWLPWGPPAFARARDEKKPVLLSIATTWCSGCREMDATSYADPSIATLINERFVPVRVDAEARPDVSERYTLGGWPTTAFLTAGGDILGGGTYVSADRMPAVLGQVLAAFDPDVPPPPRPAVTHRESPPAGAPALGDLVAAAFSAFDDTHGGFGDEPKFPLVAPLQLALDLFIETGDPAFERIVVTSLDAMGWGLPRASDRKHVSRGGGLYDDVDGGFFHYALGRDWSRPRTEKLLEMNALLIRLYLDAGERLGVTRFTERGADALRYVQTWLTDAEDGGWFASQAADEAYYAAPDRQVRTAPAVAPHQFADSNGPMVSAALHAARVFGDEGLRAFALRSLERVLLRGYRPGAGAAHVAEGAVQVRGLLADQVAMVAANLDAYDLTGNIVYEMMAEELATFAIRTMWDDAQGACFDRGDEGDQAVGLMRTRLKPFVINCDFARALARLEKTSGEASFGARAQETLAALAPRALEQGPLAAHYLLATREPLRR